MVIFLIISISIMVLGTAYIIWVYMKELRFWKQLYERREKNEQGI